jgi:ketol-acid reductoisomerase
MNLLSDAAQSETWPALKPQITKGKTLYFSHGFSPVFKDVTKVDVPTDVDVILVAPKGSGRTVRSLFREGRGINSSFAVYQDVTGQAKEKAIALGVAVGSGYLYETTFEKEVYSDLYGERGCLMGGIHGMFLAQYEVLRERGHSPSEAFNETVEEATQSLYPLIGANGMDWMYEACSTTARRGAIDWTPKFKDALKPVFNDLYNSVHDGTETQRSLDYNGQKDYRQKFEAEMEEIRNLEIWRAGKAVRYVHFTPLKVMVFLFIKVSYWLTTFPQFSPPREPEVSGWCSICDGLVSGWKGIIGLCLYLYMGTPMKNLSRDLWDTGQKVIYLGST